MSLAPYREARDEVGELLKQTLAGGRSAVGEVALMRKTLELMNNLLTNSPDAVLAYRTMAADAAGRRGAVRWRYDIQLRASNALNPHLVDDAASESYRRLRMEYIDLGQQIVISASTRTSVMIDRLNGRSYIIRDNPQIPQIMRIIATELQFWFDEHPLTPAFLALSARAGMAEFLAQRQDMVALLRLIQTLPADTEISDILIDRPAMVEAVELLISVIPVVGNVAAAYEAYAGVDLFGYRLSDLERGILAASVLLPIAGRFVRGGRLLYSEARLVALYGRDAAAWSRVVRAGGTVPGMRVVAEAEAVIRAQRRLDAALAARASTAVPEVVRASGPTVTSTDAAITALLRELRAASPAMASIDEFALRRILEKGPNVNHLKGQLLEELLESRIVPWLRDRAGAYALGIETAGRKLEFIPGHLIRDSANRQITDGILAIRHAGSVEIMAVFEAKAGRRAARELSFARGSIASLSTAERQELTAYARDIMREEIIAARLAGTAYTRTISQIESEIILSELGGQVRRDIERLAAGVSGGAASIRIGADVVPITFSPTRTKFFGVLPRDVPASTIAAELTSQGVTFEIIAADISQRQLRELGDSMVELATAMVTAPVTP